MAEKPWVQLAVAAIGAVAVIAAAWIAATAGSSSSSGESSGPQVELPKAQDGAGDLGTGSAGTADSSTILRPSASDLYEATAIITAPGVFTDSETGLRVTVEDFPPKWMFFDKSVTLKYTTPDGARGYGGRRVGFYSNEFVYENRRFIFTVEGMDREKETVTIQVKELP